MQGGWSRALFRHSFRPFFRRSSVNCNKVSHLLSAYMDGELLGYEHRLIHQHLQHCPDCRVEYEELLHMKRLLSAMRVCEPCPQLASNIVRRVSSEEAAQTGNRLGD